MFGGIAAVSMLGGLIPIVLRATHARLQFYLSLSAGVMLGAAFFHMLPHAAELIPHSFGLWTAIGVVGLYFVQRFIAPHSHELDDADDPDAAHVCNEAHEHVHRVHAPGLAMQHRNPNVLAWTTFFGLAVHSVIGGMALGGALFDTKTGLSLALLVFLPIIIHKPVDALAISSLMRSVGFATGRMSIAQGAFALMTPLGGFIAWLSGHWASAAMASSLTGAFIAISAGTFICIALGDLLPEVQFHAHDRGKLAGALVFGLAIIYSVSLLESGSGTHRHGESGASHDATQFSIDDNHENHAH